VTNYLGNRVPELGTKIGAGFTTRYNADKLVHDEETTDVEAVISPRERIELVDASIRRGATCTTTCSSIPTVGTY
jgi:hypothetical protein